MKKVFFAVLALILVFTGTSFAKGQAASKSAASKKTAASKHAKSSAASPKPAKKSLEFKDLRNKQKYRLVRVANLEWFGDNLNFKLENSFCLDDDENNCMAYGRLYTWDAARGACPDGFRLPTHADFESLWTAAGADFNAGYLLKTSYGWKGETNGDDSLKFGAMPAGNRFDDETYGNMGKFAFFWSADDSLEGTGPGNARVWYLTNKSMAFGYTAKPKVFGFSVRCVRDVK